MTRSADGTEARLEGHGGELAVAVARAHGVERMFTLSGGHVFPLFDGAVKAVPPMPIIDVRHEQTAVFAAEATAKLTRRPGLAVLTAGPGVTNGVSAVTTDREPTRLGPPTAQIRPVVGEPRLIAPIRCAVAGYLSIDRLMGLADPSRYRFHRLARRKAVGDFDAVILGQLAAADRPLDEIHAASVNEPQRPAAR